MKATVESADLRPAVLWAARILPKHPASHQMILAGLLLDATDNATITVCGFDYDTAVRATIPATVHTPGRMLVPGTVLAGLVATMPDGPVDLLPDAGRLDLRGPGLQACLPLMPADDYPTLPDLPTEVGRIPAVVLRDGVDRVTPAAGHDPTLPALTAVHVTVGDHLALEATDRHRAAILDLPYERPLDTGEPVAMLVPAGTLTTLTRTMTGTVTLHADTNPEGTARVGMAWDGRQVTTRLIDAEFPPVRTAFTPDTITHRVRADRAMLLAAVTRVTPAGRRDDPVRLTMDAGRLTVTMTGADGQSATTDIPATTDGGTDEWHCHNRYLTDALRAFRGEQVVIGRRGDSGPTDIDDPADTAYRHLMAVVQVHG